MHNNIKLLFLESSLNFEEKEAFYSLEYGVIEKTIKLSAKKSVSSSKEFIKFYSLEH